MLIRLHPRGIYDKSPRDFHKYPRDFINTPEIKCCLKSPKVFGIFILTLLIPQDFLYIIELRGGMDYRSLRLIFLPEWLIQMGHYNRKQYEPYNKED